MDKRESNDKDRESSQPVKACLLCSCAMVCYDTADISGETDERSHYLMACSACGYGPAQAFTTNDEAISHWNQFATQEHEHEHEHCSHTPITKSKN